jgi:hypothetical protein
MTGEKIIAGSACSGSYPEAAVEVRTMANQTQPFAAQAAIGKQPRPGCAARSSVPTRPDGNHGQGDAVVDADSC